MNQREKSRVETAQPILAESPEETQAIAARLFDGLQPGAVVAIHGTLGAGKTCFAQGLASAAGVRDPVCSPTYTVINEYQGRLPFHHIDLYRLGDPGEVADLGLEEVFERGGITVIEWPERAGNLLPGSTIHVTIQRGASEQERWIDLAACGETNDSSGH